MQAVAEFAKPVDLGFVWGFMPVSVGIFVQRTVSN